MILDNFACKKGFDPGHHLGATATVGSNGGQQDKTTKIRAVPVRPLSRFVYIERFCMSVDINDSIYK